VLTVALATGITCASAWAAGEGDQPPPRPAEPRGGVPGVPRGGPEAQTERIKRAIADWERILGQAHYEPLKKVAGEAISKGKEFQTILEKQTVALQAGKDDIVRNLAGEVQAQDTVLSKYLQIVPICVEIDRTKAMQDKYGKDDADLNARCQKVIDLLNKKLELYTQLIGLENELNKERAAFRQPGMRGPREAPKPPPEAAPQGK
jgi:hypothetical protein